LDHRAKEREAKTRMEADAAQAWAKIQNTTDQAELRGFMKRYPDSPLALTNAPQRLSVLEREAADRAEKLRAAKAAWDAVKGTSDPAELRDFVARYPDSPYATRDAKLRIELIEREAAAREAKARAEAAAREAKARAEAAAREAKARAEAAAREAKAQAEAAAREVKERAEAEMAQVWENTKDSQNAADFKGFIKRYPNSRFTSEAKQRLGLLELKPDLTTQPDTREPPGTGRHHEPAPSRTIVNIPPHHEPPAPHHEQIVNAPPRHEPPALRHEHENVSAPPHRVANSHRDEGAPRRHGGGGGYGGSYAPSGGSSSHAQTMSGVGF
jgi:hypothetical protein